MGGGIIEFVKKHRFVYSCYYWLMTSLVNFLKLFVRPDDKLILFVVYGGKFFSDSPKCLYEAMQNDKRYEKYKKVWAFRNPDNFPEVENRIKIDTLKYYITALKARCWITNESVTRALKFKGKKTFYFSTTHTALPKHSGRDAKKESTFTSIGRTPYDCTCAQSDAERIIQMQKYGLEEKNIAICGYPKNDAIANHNAEDVKKIRKKLQISDGRKIILYAPTFREKGQEMLMLDFKKWKEALSDQYILLYRAHHTANSKHQIKEYSDFIIDVSTYPDNTELLILADCLISDYSGIFFEFGVQEKPMYCFAYDYEEYIKHRGLYINLPEVLPGGIMNEDEFLQYFSSANNEEVMKKVNLFRGKYIQEYGHATEKSLDIIFQNIQEDKK